MQGTFRRSVLVSMFLCPDHAVADLADTAAAEVSAMVIVVST